MKLPSFDEFLAEFKEEEHDLLKKIDTQEDPSSLKEAFGLTVKASTIATFEILALYHKWISKHLESLN